VPQRLTAGPAPDTSCCNVYENAGRKRVRQ